MLLKRSPPGWVGRFRGRENAATPINITGAKDGAGPASTALEAVVEAIPV